jgi:molybdate transport system substrate-binding protein
MKNLLGTKACRVGWLPHTISTFSLSKLSRLLSRTLFWVALLGLTGCGGGSTESSVSELTVAAAADLMPLKDDLAASYQRSTGMALRFTFGSSGLLARQIENGAPFDVYLSANERFVDELGEQGRLLAGSVKVYAYGRLGLWPGNRYARLEDLLGEAVKHVAIANPVHAPYGLAARQALENRGLWAALQPKIVYGENVRQALQFAESGNAEAAVTAWSLVMDKGGIAIPPEWHAPIRQAGAVVAGSRAARDGLRFLNFLSSTEGQSLLRKHGLTPPAAGEPVPRKRAERSAGRPASDPLTPVS